MCRLINSIRSVEIILSMSSDCLPYPTSRWAIFQAPSSKLDLHTMVRDSDVDALDYSRALRGYPFGPKTRTTVAPHNL